MRTYYNLFPTNAYSKFFHMYIFLTDYIVTAD